MQMKGFRVEGNNHYQLHFDDSDPVLQGILNSGKVFVQQRTKAKDPILDAADLSVFHGEFSSPKVFPSWNLQMTPAYM